MKKAIDILVGSITDGIKADEALKYTQAALNLAHADSVLVNTRAAQKANGVVTLTAEQYDATIRSAVDRFLCWGLPNDFSPDCGIGFTPIKHPACWPIGTNLLTGPQAEQMLRECLPFDQFGSGA